MVISLCGTNGMYITWAKSVCKTVRGRRLTAEAQVRPRAIPSRICGAQNYFLRISGLPRQYCPIKAPHSPSSSKQPLSEGLPAKPGGLSNERDVLLYLLKHNKVLLLFLLACETPFFALPLATFQGAHRPTICTWLS